MEDYSGVHRFRHGLNRVSSSTSKHSKGNNELSPVLHAQTHPSVLGQLIGQPSVAALPRAAATTREAAPGYKDQSRVICSLSWTAPKARAANRSSPALSGGSKIYQEDQAAPAVREVPKYERSRPVARPLSVGPSVRRSQAISSRRTHASSVNLPEQRRLAHRQQQMLEFRPHTDNDGKVPRRVFNAGDGLSMQDGPHSYDSHLESPRWTDKHASADPDIPHLQKRRTWMLLQHLVDQLEKEGRPDALLQRPELLQKLLHVVMPLVPLSAALGKLATTSRTSTSRLQGSAFVAHQSATREAQLPSPMPASTAFLRTVHANAPLRNTDHHLRPTSLHYSRASPSKTPPATALRGAAHVPREWSNDGPAAPKTSLQFSEGPADAPRNAPNRLPKDRDFRRASSTKVRVVPKRDVGNSIGSGGLEKPLHSHDKPLPARSVSTGKSYMHVASRLPQGALQYRRPLKTRPPAALMEKNSAGRRPFQLTAVDWATSRQPSNESGTEPVASARSGDSEESLKSAPTPSLDSTAEDCPDWGLGRQLESGRCGLVDWNSNRPQSSVRFSVTREVEALPPSPRASNSDEEMSGRSALASQGSLVAHEESQAVDRSGQLPGLTKTSAPSSGGRRRQPGEPRPTSTRRHTVFAAVASPQHSAEGGKLIRSVEGSLEGPSGSSEKRERRFTAAPVSKFKSTAAAIKGGRFVLTGEELNGGAKSQGMARIPLLKDIPKAREGRRAAVQAVTPRNGDSLSPKLPAGAKRRVSPVIAKKIGRKGSRTLQKSSSISPRELSPPSARGRRMSVPPPRRATQAKIAPTFPPRARNVADRSSPPRVSSAPFKTSARRKAVKLIHAKEKDKTLVAHKDEESPTPEAQGMARLDEEDERGQGSKSEEEQTATEPEPEPPYPYLTLKELPPLEQPLRPLSRLCTLPLKEGPKSPPPIDVSYRAFSCL